MKVENINEHTVKEILKANINDLPAKNNAPHMQRKNAGKKEKTFAQELSSKQMTPTEEKQLRDNTHERISDMMKDSLTLSGSENTVQKNQQNQPAETDYTDKAAIISALLDNPEKRRHSAYSQKTEPKSSKPRLSFFNIILMCSSLFLIIAGFMYMPAGILWIIIGALIFIYSIVKK